MLALNQRREERLDQQRESPARPAQGRRREQMQRLELVLMLELELAPVPKLLLGQAESSSPEHSYGATAKSRLWWQQDQEAS